MAMNMTKRESGRGTGSSITQTATDNLTEREAVRRSQEGDVAAFEYLYKSHSRHVYSICLRMLKNPSDAEDLTQHVFLCVFRKIGTFRGDSRFSTWLHRVAVNTVLMHLRQRKPMEVLAYRSDHGETRSDDPGELGAGDTSMLSVVDRLNLKRAMRKLPSACRKILLLHHVFGYEHAEIAGILGRSTSSSKMQLYRARKQLRELLQGQRSTATV